MLGWWCGLTTNDTGGDEMVEDDPNMPHCQYVSDTEDGRGHTDDEDVRESGVVLCTAEAEVVIRRVGLRSFMSGTRVVCRPHAGYLLSSECPIEWEQSGEEDEVRNNV